MSESASEAAAVIAGSKQVASNRPEDWAWVDRTIWTERMLAALGNGVRGGKWFSLIDKVYRPATLRSAWQQVLVNRGAAGVDRVSVERFAGHLDRYLGELGQELESGRYRPLPVRRVEIEKADGKLRPLGIPTVRDRVAQAAVKRVIEPIFEQMFAPTSFGFRPGRGCKDALRVVDGLLQAGHTHVVDADLKGYFDSIPHDRLKQRLAAHISDSRLLALLDGWIEQDVVQELKRWKPTSGTPQGAVISPLLANLYLHDLDVKLAGLGLSLVRYADDFVILCQTAAEATQALEVVRAWVAAEGLQLHPDKTHVGDCRIAGQGFEFLGYRFETGRRWVRDKSLKALKAKIRSKTRRTEGNSLKQIVSGLNPMLRGWFNYFKHAQRGIFRILDGFLRRRLRALLRKQDKRPGAGHCMADHHRWPNAFFAAVGLFTMTEARHAASQSR
ncbi:MAG: group II intron reverse transcriptase/maturase [Rhodanobacteraceae bacterium]|nr:group II intron reverse transcriptase/maturase [Rhodanobacteraceae bacterium]